MPTDRSGDFGGTEHGGRGQRLQRGLTELALILHSVPVVWTVAHAHLGPRRQLPDGD